MLHKVLNFFETTYANRHTTDDRDISLFYVGVVQYKIKSKKDYGHKMFILAAYINFKKQIYLTRKVRVTLGADSTTLSVRPQFTVQIRETQKSAMK